MISSNMIISTSAASRVIPFCCTGLTVVVACSVSIDISVTPVPITWIAVNLVDRIVCWSLKEGDVVEIYATIVGVQTSRIPAHVLAIPWAIAYLRCLLVIIAGVINRVAAVVRADYEKQIEETNPVNGRSRPPMLDHLYNNYDSNSQLITMPNSITFW